MPLAHALIARIHWAHGEAMATVRAFARMLGSVHDTVPAYARLAHYLTRYADGDAERRRDTFAEIARTGDEGFRDIYQYMAARSAARAGALRVDAGRARNAAHAPSRRRLHAHRRPRARVEPAAAGTGRGGAGDLRRLEATAGAAGTSGLDEFFDLRAELPMGVARCRSTLGRHDEAAPAFERAIAADAQGMYAVENQLGLATAYERLGQMERAETTLAGVIAAHPDEPKLGAVRQQLARVQAARTP